jgi:hypothetical protein
MADELKRQDIDKLRKAVELLEQSTITATITKLIGTPLEKGVKALPDSISNRIGDLVQVALTKAADAALWTLNNNPGEEASTKSNKLFAAVSGAVGGAFGFTALAIELPISTTIMMRAVADIARSEGFNLEDTETKAHCISVFAFGGPSPDDDGVDTSYYASRSFIAKTMGNVATDLAAIAAKNAADSSAKHAVNAFSSKEASSFIAKIIEAIAVKFNVTITPKIAAQIAPGVGAITGATINTMFTDYYQDIARGHFIILNLEKAYGAELIKIEYSRLASEKKGLRLK